MLSIIPLSACWGEVEDGLTLEVRNYIIKHYFNNEPSRYRKLVGEDRLQVCENYILINMYAEVDGPFYYTNLDGTLHSSCGGNCMVPQTEKAREDCMTQCPPPDLKCESSK